MTTRRHLLQGACAAALLASTALPALVRPGIEHVVWDQSTVNGNFTFAGDVHADLVQTVVQLAEKHNIHHIVVTPLGLTLMQSGSNGQFTRWYSESGSHIWFVSVGRLSTRTGDIPMCMDTKNLPPNDFTLYFAGDEMATVDIKRDTLSFV